MGSEPWGLSGEQFLDWYFIGVGCALVLALVIRFLPKFLGRGGQVFRPSAEMTGFLAAGPDRAVQAVAADLLAAGALRAQSTGRVRLTGSTVPSSPLAAQFLTRAASSHLLPDITRHLRKRSALWNVGHDLADLGLLVPAHVASRFRYASTVPLLAVFVVGFIRWCNGFALGRPIGFLTAALAGTIVLFFVVLNFQRKRHQRTVAGDRALRELRRAGLHDAATAVALGGVGKYPDARVAAALQKSIEPPARRRTAAAVGAASGGGFFWGGGGGSSCGGGGGGGCGGGGGGCGGGGGGGGGGCGG
ncbi:TIGR04222 domain-containing membrane protein [Kutzneria sp. NPDC051319]|uniref:TIGR04222 domain-containing membrane protein n=1 Tax=Kutzneria sp. NPDC051319 TaxID=3155047 RepID=UPI00341455B6